MIKVNNREVIRRLAVRQIKSSEKMNVVVILSIVLTCIMFTAIFSIGGSIIKSFQEETMRQVGGSCMAGLKYVLPEDYDIICTDQAVKNPSYRILVGVAANENLRNISAEINYAQDEDAKSMFCYPTEGRMPQERNEIAMSTLVLDELKIPHKLGETVALDIDIDGTVVSEKFTLCGFWEGDKVAMAQECFVSREFCDEVAPTPEIPFYSSENIIYAGYWMVDFNFSNSWNIEKKLDQLMQRCGFLDREYVPDYGINWAYVTDSVDMETVIGMGTLLFIILLAGYLIIYNVFYINVTANIRSYGLLKTIGTTGRQLKRMVRYQALIYSAIGIPLGFLLGTLLSDLLLPHIMKSTFQLETTVLSLNIPIYAASAFFTLITVFVSCQKPCKYAASVTPIEALRHSDVSGVQKEKRTAKVSTVSMAGTNFSRNKKKTMIVILSLSLSITLLNSIYTTICGFDVDKYVEGSIIGDFLISDISMMKHVPGYGRELAGVKEDDIHYFNSIDGVNSISEIYCSISKIKLDDTHYNLVTNFMNRYPEMFENEYAKTVYTEEHILWCDIYGINRSAFQLIMDGADMDKFFSNDYAVVYTYYVGTEDNSGEDIFYSVGETLSLELPDGTVKNYEVMAVQEVPYALSTKAYDLLGAQVIIPDSDLIAHSDEQGALYIVLNADKNKIDVIESEINSYVNKINTNLAYTSKQTYIDEFRDYINMFWMVGGTLSLILAMIGILNFVNVIITGVFARQHEFAMMQAVGMTGKQLKTMLIWEGMLYALFTAVSSLLFGSIISRLIVCPFANEMFYFTYHFTLMPIMICIPLLILLSIIIPFAAYHAICSGSVVDRLRRTE